LFSIVVIGLGALIFAQANQSKEKAAQATAPAKSNVKQPTITPQKGQSAAQQQQDLQSVYEIATSKTGVDPRALGAITAGSSTAFQGCQVPARLKRQRDCYAPERCVWCKQEGNAR